MEKCEFFNQCAFIHSLDHCSSVIKEGWVLLYCENQMKSAKCHRKQFYLTEKEPPDNMTPSGAMI